MDVIESLLDDARAANQRLGQSIDEMIAEMIAVQAWARTVGMPYPTTPSAVSDDERSLRTGATSRGPV